MKILEEKCLRTPENIIFIDVDWQKGPPLSNFDKRKFKLKIATA